MGSSKACKADVRILAATNCDLAAAVREPKFREDLFYRLHVLSIRMPSLTERREDIAELAAVFCENACLRHGLPQLRFSRNALRALETAEWPGNVRQLLHTVEMSAIRAASEGARQIERDHVFPQPSIAPTGPDDILAAGLTFQEATRRFPVQLIRTVLEETDWNVPEAARRLDVARPHLYALIRAFGVARPIS